MTTALVSNPRSQGLKTQRLTAYADPVTCENPRRGIAGKLDIQGSDDQNCRDETRVIRRIRNFLGLARSRKRLLAEVTLELLRAAWIVRRRPFQSYVTSLGQAKPGDFVDESLEDLPIGHLRDLHWALTRVNRAARGRFTCLMLAMAGKRVLDRRKVPNSLVLAARPDRGADNDPFGAHSWLRSGRFVVIGAEESVGHIPLVSYHSSPLD